MLTEKDGVTDRDRHVDITVRIPLVAGKIEGLIGKIFGSAMLPRTAPASPGWPVR